MFSKEFYPTPEHLIKRMLSPYYNTNKMHGLSHNEKYNFDNLTILEPSAGKGDILDFITKRRNKFNRNKTEQSVFAIEKNPELQSILKDKNYPLIECDFLEYQDQMYFDLIIMNPPFSNGAKHLLKAFEVAQKTNIICLLNAETIKNPHTRERKLLIEKIEKYNGKVEYCKEQFIDAERTTGIEVAIVRVMVEKENNKFDFDFDKQKEKKIDFSVDFVENEIARQDLIGNLNLRYEAVREAYIELLKAEAKYNHLKNAFLDGEGYISSGYWELKDGQPKLRYNYLSQKMKAYMWKTVISKLNIKKYMSAKVLNNFEAFVKQQSNMAFTKENVSSFFQMIMNNRSNIWDQAVEDVFDMLTDYYHGNRKHIEGWKTNDKYKVKRKVILPNWVVYDSYLDSSYLREIGTKMKINYNCNRKFNDIDKVMAYITGHNLLEEETVNTTLENKFNNLGRIKTGQKFDNRCRSKYFDIKFYKKGTVHLEFLDKKIWEMFNLIACDNKNWLPENEKKSYRTRRDNYKKENEVKVTVPKLF